MVCGPSPCRQPARSVGWPSPIASTLAPCVFRSCLPRHDLLTSFAPKRSRPSGPRRVRCRGRISRCPVCTTRRLPWGCQTPPLRRSRSRKVSPACVSAGFGPVLPHTVHVPPTWSLTTSTASSSETLAGLLHPAPDPGVHRVSARAVAPACGLPPTSLGLVPPLRCSPSSAFPACAAEPASPPAPAPSPLLRHACRADLEALLRTRVRGTTAALPRRCARCAHGLPFLELPRSEAVASSRGPMPCLRRPARRSPFGSLPSACRLSATSPHPRGCILP
jgi:hypothetical protein